MLHFENEGHLISRNLTQAPARYRYKKYWRLKAGNGLAGPSIALSLSPTWALRGLFLPLPHRTASYSWFTAADNTSHKVMRSFVIISFGNFSSSFLTNSAANSIEFKRQESHFGISYHGLPLLKIHFFFARTSEPGFQSGPGDPVDADSITMGKIQSPSGSIVIIYPWFGVRNCRNAHKGSRNLANGCLGLYVLMG